MYLAVKEIKTQNDYLLLLSSENGKVRQFDMKPYLNLGVFKELKDPVLLKTVKPCFDSVEWANEADLDPEILYKNSNQIKQECKFPIGVHLFFRGGF